MGVLPRSVVGESRGADPVPFRRPRTWMERKVRRDEGVCSDRSPTGGATDVLSVSVLSVSTQGL